MAENEQDVDAAGGPIIGEQPNVAAPVGQLAHEPPPSQRLPGQRQGTWVYYDGRGYYYHTNKTTNAKRYLSCAETNCRARAWMRLEENSPIHQSDHPEHQHLPNFSSVEKMKFMDAVKRRSREETNRSVSSILEEESIEKFETAASLSRINATRAMKKARLHMEPPLPQTIADFCNKVGETEDLRRTKDGRSDFFVMGHFEEEHCVPFVSHRIAEKMKGDAREAPQHLFMDATFKVVPRRPAGLVQVFTVHALYLDVVLPIAFFLMSSRTTEVYVKILQFLKNHVIDWEVTYVTTDFEMGLVEAVRQVFGPEKHRGCWFHYSQAIWRTTVRYGLSRLCEEVPAAFEVVKMVMALPHLPARRGPPNSMEIPPFSIADGLDTINNRIQNEMLDARLYRLTDYVRRFWLGRVGAASLSVFNMARRTNNNVESFNAKLLHALGRRKNAWIFVRGLQGIEQEAFCDLERLFVNIDVRRPPSSVYLRNTANVRQTLSLLCQGLISLERCLRRLSHIARNFRNMEAVVGDEDEEEAAPVQPLNWDELMDVEVIAEEEVVAQEA